jgi:hypothetical protein
MVLCFTRIFSTETRLHRPFFFFSFREQHRNGEVLDRRTRQMKSANNVEGHSEEIWEAPAIQQLEHEAGNRFAREKLVASNFRCFFVIFRGKLSREKVRGKAPRNYFSKLFREKVPVLFFGGSYSENFIELFFPNSVHWSTYFC